MKCDFCCPNSPYTDPQSAIAQQMAGFGMWGGAVGGSLWNASNALAPTPPKRKDFGPNQIAWIEKNLGFKSLIAGSGK